MALHIMASTTDKRADQEGVSPSRPPQGSVKASIVIELEGPARSVFEVGSSLLRPVVDHLPVSKVARVHVEYGEGSTTEHVLDGADGLELLGREGDRECEECFWALALQAYSVALRDVPGGTEEPS